MKKYNVNIGAIRIICALSVLGIHITSGYVYNLEIAYVLNQFFRYCVPIFVIISGYAAFISRNYTSNLGFYFSRVKRVVIPYILWTVIYMVYDSRHNISYLWSKGFLKDFIHNMVFGYSHLYFIIIIIQMYLLFPIIKKYYNNKTAKYWLTLSFCVSLYFQLSIYLYRLNIVILPRELFKYSHLLFPTWIFYFIFGMYIVDNMNKIRKIPFRALFLMWLVSLVMLVTDSKLTNTFGYSIKPMVMLYSMLSFYMFGELCRKINFNTDRSITIIKRLDTMTFSFYLGHSLIIKLIKSYSKILNFNLLWVDFEGMILLFILTSIVTYYLVYLLSYVKGSKYLGVTVLSNK